MNGPEDEPNRMTLGQALVVIPTAFLIIRYVVLPIVEPIAQAVSDALFR